MQRGSCVLYPSTLVGNWLLTDNRPTVSRQSTDGRPMGRTTVGRLSVDCRPTVSFRGLKYTRSGNAWSLAILALFWPDSFALAGTITCSKTSTHAPDPLIRATAPHRRARSAAWSYHFSAEENWCDVTVHLATAILLWEVQIQPHSAALASKSLCRSNLTREWSARLYMSDPLVGVASYFTISIDLKYWKCSQPGVMFLRPISR